MNQFMTAVVQYLEENRTKIAFGLGGLLTIGGTVYACKKTLNLPKIMEEHKKRLTETKMAVETGIQVDKETSEGIKLTEKAKKRAMFKCYAKTGWELTKNYAAPVAIEATGLGLMTYSDVTLEQQKVGLLVAVANGAAKYEQVLEYIRKNYGEEEVTAAKYNLEKEVQKGKKGEPDTVTYKAPEKFGKYSVFLRRGNDPTDPNIHDLDDGFFLAELQSAQQALNRKGDLSWDSKVSMADCYSMTRAESSSDDVMKESRIMGYIFDKKNCPRNDAGIPEKIKVYAMTVWPTAEMLPIDYLIEERAQYMSEGKAWDRLDKDAVLIDFTAPEPIIQSH